MPDSDNSFPISNHAQSEIDRFQAVAKHWAIAAQHVVISYLAVEIDGAKWLHWATVRYVYAEMRLSLLEMSVVSVDGVTVGRESIDLSKEQFDLNQIVRSGQLEIGGQVYGLPRAAGQSLNATFFADNHPQFQPGPVRSPTLILSGGQSPNIDGRMLVDLAHRLRCLDKPYDGLADLLDEHLLPSGLLQRTDTAIEILLEKPAETILADSTISRCKLSAKIVGSQRIDPSLLKIGVKVERPHVSEDTRTLLK